MAHLAITLDDTQLRWAQRELRDLPGKAHKARYVALKRTADAGKSELIRAFTREFDVGRRFIEPAITTKVDSDAQEAVITLIDHKITLEEFKPKAMAALTFQPLKSKDPFQLEHAFIAKVEAGANRQSARAKARFAAAGGKKKFHRGVWMRTKYLPGSGPNARSARYKQPREIQRKPKESALAKYRRGRSIEFSRRRGPMALMKFKTSKPLELRKGGGFTPRGYVQRHKVYEVKGPSPYTGFGFPQMTTFGQEQLESLKARLLRNVISQVSRFAKVSVTEASASYKKFASYMVPNGD